MLRLEDVFGHAAYGIPGGRPVGEDYHAGDEVLIADGIHDARTKVLAADSAAGTVTVASVRDAARRLEDRVRRDRCPIARIPTLRAFLPPGGCYLRKFNPHGTACYYWGRLDKEWDLACRRYGRRVVANFADAPGDLARDGRSWTTVKDYVQWHEVARTIAGHVIDRYGADALNFTWSIFNEPDLGPIFWRADWNELQKFYDYTTDAILRAFEDRGFRSDKVFIGGLELGGIFGTHLKLKEFLAHCSPRAHAEGASAATTPLLPTGSSTASGHDAWRRSAAITRGKGSPCDFVSIHSYNRSELMAAKLIRAKEMALEIDAEYYRALWVNSHEACPDWMPPPDVAAADAYLGNGYFATWCLDVVHRQLRQAARRPALCVRRDDPDGLAAARELRRDQRGHARASCRRQRRWPGRPDGDCADADFPRAGAAVGPGRSVLGAARADRGRPCRHRLRIARRSGSRAGRCYTPTTRRTLNRDRRHRSTSRSISAGWTGPGPSECRSIASIGTITRPSAWPDCSATGPHRARVPTLRGWRQ